MRVAFFVHSFPELSETFILRQVTGLLDRGHEVRIFARREGAGGPAHDAVAAYGLGRLVRVLPRREGGGARGAARQAARLARELAAAPGRLAAAGGLRPGYARTLGGWPALAGTLAALAAERPFDVVHCHYGDVGLRYRVAARLWRAPLVVSFYGYDASAYPRAAGAGAFAPLFAAADAVTSLSAHMDGRLRALGCPAGLLRRVPLAADPAAYGPLPRRRARPGAPARLLTVARLTEKKGVEYALRALALVRDEFPALRYAVVGDGPLRGELAALAAALGLRGRVRLLGARPDGCVRAALGRADLFLLASVTAADGDEEGTPTAVIEAALAGLPVLATRHAGIPELVRDGASGLLVPERDPGALADGLRRLLRAPDRWAAMGAAGRRHVEGEHATAAVAERLERLYEELRASTPAASR